MQLKCGDNGELGHKRRRGQLGLACFGRPPDGTSEGGAVCRMAGTLPYHPCPTEVPTDCTGSTGVGVDLQVMFRESLLAACRLGRGQVIPREATQQTSLAPYAFGITRNVAETCAHCLPRPRFTLQQIPQPPAGLVQLRFGTPCRALQNLPNFAVFVSNDVVEQKVFSITLRQLVQRA